MRKKIIKYRNKVTGREILADLIFLLVSFMISIIAILIFDIHWSLYPGESLFPPSRIVGISKSIYIIWGLLGSMMGFFIIKLFLIGVEADIAGKKK